MVGIRCAQCAVAGMVLFAAIVVAQAAHAAACADAEEQTVLQTRILQTELMVGALSCGKRDLYNQFVEKFKPVLADRGTTLRLLFQKRHASGAKRELDSFITRMANAASRRSFEQPDGYCAQSARMFKRALALRPDGLAAYAAALPAANSHGIETCL